MSLGRSAFRSALQKFAGAHRLTGDRKVLDTRMARASLLLLIVLSLGYQHGSSCARLSPDRSIVPPLAHTHTHDDENDHEHEEGHCPDTHHFCVGTHVFFMRDAGDQSPIASIKVVWAVLNLDTPPLADPSLSTRLLTQIDNSPPAPTLPLRAELQVYLI